MSDQNARFKLRRGTSTLWASVNPILEIGEPGFETDTGKLRIGDGSTAFTSLPYFATYDDSAYMGNITTIYTGNLNSLTGRAFVPISAGVTNGWTGAGAGDFVLNLVTDASNTLQVGFDGDSGAATWRRVKVSGTWGTWKKILMSATTFGETMVASANAAAARLALGLRAGAIADYAAQSEAEGGTDNVAVMTALRTKQAVDLTKTTRISSATMTSVIGSRALSTNYVNTTGFWKVVSVACSANGMYILAGPTAGTQVSMAGANNVNNAVMVMIPPGWTYSAFGSGLTQWLES